MHYAKLIPVYLALVLMGSCVKDEIADTPTKPDPIIPAGMHAKINGVAWTANYVSHISILGGMHYIEVSGYDTSGKSIKLVINNFKSRSTYVVPSSKDSAFMALDYNVFADKQGARDGKITIQAINDSMVGGAFHFVTDSFDVTEGTFYVNYN